MRSGSNKQAWRRSNCPGRSKPTGRRALSLSQPARRGICRWLGTAVLVLTAPASWPQEQAETRLQGITATATADPVFRTGDVVDDESASSHTRIGRAELQNSAVSLADIIARQSGVQYRQSGGFGSFSSVSIRAATGAQTDVYLDGILLNSGGFPVVDLSALEMLNLDSIDVYRGSTPVQLGHGSIGGALNLNSPRRESEPTTRLRLGIGSLSRREWLLSHQAAHGNWDWTTAVAMRHSDNDYSFINDNTTPLNPADDERQRRNNAAADRQSALLRAGYQYDADTRADLTAQLSQRDLGVPEFRNNEDNVASYETQSRQLQLSLTRDAVGAWNTRHSLYHNTQGAQFQDRFSQVGLGAQDSDSDTRTLGARSYWEYPANNGTFALSLEYRHERYDSSDALDASAAIAAERRSTLASAHYAWFDSSERLTLIPALRWQHERQQSTLSGEDDADQTQTTGVDTGLQMGLLYRLSPTLTLTANAGSYYREPSFGELYGSSGLINGSPTLEPEQGLNLDLGLRHERDAFRAGATLFASERDELIVTAFDSRGIGRAVNAGAARVLGLELELEVPLSQRVSLRSNLTWQSARSRDPQAGFRDRKLPGEATLAWFSRLQYRYHTATFWHELTILRDRFYDRANILPAEDSDEHAVGIDWHHAHWQASLGIHNLGDRNIEDFNGFPKPGRTGFLSITRTFTPPTYRQVNDETDQDSPLERLD